MGNCASDEATQASKAIDQQNRKDFKKSARVAKLLLLGTGEVLQPSCIGNRHIYQHTSI